MKTHARVAIIGGGVAGVGLLYHLIKLGWSDVVLVEKSELTAGSTWHAAGNTPHFIGNISMMRIHQASTRLFSTLEAETGQATGFHPCGSIRLATNQEELDQHRHLAGQARNVGLDYEIISPNEMKMISPLVETHGVLAATYTPGDGHIDPSSLTNAMAIGARNGGAEIYRQTPVTDTRLKANGEWEVVTPKGTITAEIVVNAAGTWAREVGQMVGLDLAIVSMEHQYLVTEDVPEVVALEREFPVLRDPASYYVRQEGKGLLVGPYETRGAVAWGVDGIPKAFGQDLLPNDLDRIQDFIDIALARVPALGTAGIKRHVNGPITHTPDGEPFMGPAPGLRNYWLHCGFGIGIAQGGGAGQYMAEWIVSGEPSMDMIEFDGGRFGTHATVPYTEARAVDTYQRMYAVPFPIEELAAGRPMKTTPIYGRLKERGAFFEARNGWERAAWFAPQGVEPEETPSFRHTGWFEHVGAECRAVRERVGVIDLSAFSRYEARGPGAEAYLDHISANRMPRKVGGIALTQMLNTRGNIKCEATVTRLGDDLYHLLHPATAEIHDFDWLEKHLPEGGGVRLDNVTGRYGCLAIAGPRSREVLAKLTDDGLGNAAFPWLSARRITIGLIPVWALRVSYVGELGWELHHEMEYHDTLYASLMEAGAEFDIVDFGTRAMNSMRLEKAYRAMGTDLTEEVNPLEVGFERLVDWDGGDFIGRDALLAARAKGVETHLVYMSVSPGDVDAITNAPVFSNEELVGIVSSGGYGHWVGKSIAFALVGTAYTAPGTALEIDIVGESRTGIVEAAALHDPRGERLKA